MVLQKLRILFVGCITAVAAFVEFYRSVIFFAFGGEYKECPSFPYDRRARIHAYSIGSLFRFWKKEQNSKCFHKVIAGEVAAYSVPFTIIPLSFWLSFKIFYFLAVFAVYPFTCLILSFFKTPAFHLIPATFRDFLLHPSLTAAFSFHSAICNQVLAMENPNLLETLQYDTNTIDLLSKAEEKNLKVVEVVDSRTVVVKNANVEGGMGIHFFRNAIANGKFLIQMIEPVHPSLKEFVKEDDPSPRFHLISVSPIVKDEEDDEPIHIVSCTMEVCSVPATRRISALFFDVDPTSNTIGNGYSEASWCNTGLNALKRGNKWRREEARTATFHELEVSGRTLAEIKAVVLLAKKAHFELAVDVPVASWVIQLTEERGAVVESVDFICKHWSSFTNQKLLYSTLHAHIESSQAVEERKEGRPLIRA